MPVVFRTIYRTLFTCEVLDTCVFFFFFNEFWRQVFKKKKKYCIWTVSLTTLMLMFGLIETIHSAIWTKMLFSLYVIVMLTGYFPVGMSTCSDSIVPLNYKNISGREWPFEVSQIKAHEFKTYIFIYIYSSHISLRSGETSLLKPHKGVYFIASFKAVIEICRIEHISQCPENILQWPLVIFKRRIIFMFFTECLFYWCSLFNWAQVHILCAEHPNSLPFLMPVM